VSVLEKLKANTPPPSGGYVCAVTGATRPINDSRREGVRFVLEVAEGTATGRRAAVELITNLKVGGNRSRLLSDSLALEAWCDCLGVDDAETPVELITKLREAAVGKRIEFELSLHRWRGGVDVYLVGVRLADV
jgi:hypothetical protein